VGVARSELLDVCDHDVRVVGIVDVRLSVQLRAERPAAEVWQDTGRAVEAGRVRSVDSVGDLVADREVRCDREHSPARDSERQHRDQSGLAAADRYLLNGAVAPAGKVLDRRGVPLGLRIAQRRVALDAHIRRSEQLRNLFVRQGHTPTVAPQLDAHPSVVPTAACPPDPRISSPQIGGLVA